MEVTCSSLKNEKRIHRRLLHGQGHVENFHLVVVWKKNDADDSGESESDADDNGTGDDNKTSNDTSNDTTGDDTVSTLMMDCLSLSKSIRNVITKCQRVLMLKAPFYFLLHPTFLSIISDYEVSGIHLDLRGRFSLVLQSDHRIIMEVAKEMYEKLGLDGTRLDKKGVVRYRIELDLLASNLKPGQKFRSRVLDNFNTILKEPLNIQLTCSKVAFPILQDLCISCKVKLEELSVELHCSKPKLLLPIPLNIRVLPTNQLPSMEDLEDWGLWLGAIITDSNILTNHQVRVDPFISTCYLPEGSTQRYSHVSLGGGGGVISSSGDTVLLSSSCIIELIETIAQNFNGTWDNICIVGRRRGRSDCFNGFSMYLDNEQNFVFCST